MSKLNQAGSHPRLNAAVSANGNTQHLKSDRNNLIELLSTTLFGRGDYYASSSQRTNQLIAILDKMVAANDLDFIANAIVYARSHMNIRVFPIVAAVQFAHSLRKQGKKFPNLRLMVSSVIQRADQITDLLNYAIQVFGDKKVVPAAVRRGVADAFNNFNEYHFAKYNRDNKMKFTDAMRIVHPSPKDENQAVLFDKIMNDSRPDDKKTPNGLLETPYTWETELSAGKKPKNEIWTELVDSGKLGYTALLKNLRNICADCGNTATIRKVCAILTDPVRIEKSRVLPFELVQAFLHVENPTVRTALNDAMEYALCNVGVIANRIWVLTDSSGSMASSGVNGVTGGYGRNSTGYVAADIAAIFATAIVRSADKDPESDVRVHVTLFDSHARHLKLDCTDSFSTIRQQVREAMKGGTTNLRAGLAEYDNLPFVPDLVVVISDMQVNQMGSFSMPNIKGTKIALNVTSDPSTPLSDIQGWKQITGVSNNVLDFIKQTANGENYLAKFDVPFTGGVE